MSIERELREIKAEVEKLERVAGRGGRGHYTLPELRGMGHEEVAESIGFWKNAFKGKVTSIYIGDNIGIVYLKVASDLISMQTLQRLGKGPKFLFLDLEDVSKGVIAIEFDLV